MKGKKLWRLSRTLKRRVDVRPIEQEDVKYAYGAYKSGKLPMFPEGMDAPSFKEAFEAYVLTSAEAAWTIISESKVGFAPVGLAFGGWAPQQTYMVIIGIVWFPWASKRVILEGTVGFFNMLRKQMKWMGFASSEHKPVYEVCCAHGIMRRVGTTNMTEQPSAVYEGRA